MSSVDFEYQIRKDVRNNPIVREVDHQRHRELWRWMLVGGFLVGVLLFSAWQHFVLLRNGYDMERLERERAEQVEIQRKLQLEIESLLSPSRIERIAIEKLHMVPPAPGATVVIERVEPPARAGSAVVASR
ncbi:MAG TPA: cell division protein FtsL [Vicinamibacterales bacterium]|nr:cell division protein FtsL [Vicinamibacterales bacterium]